MIKEHLILAINPGSTSTKLALYQNEQERWVNNIEHSAEELTQYKEITSQVHFRKNTVMNVLSQKGLDPKALSAIVGRGGLLPPVKSGGYAVNQAMREYLLNSGRNFHASNLGALVADEIARMTGITAYIYDAVSADELQEVARITGLPEVKRVSFCHVLNTKAVARKHASSRGKQYHDENYIVAHLGGGITITAHKQGCIVDIISDDEGTFSPERIGALPLRRVIEMCYSGQFSFEDMLAKLRGQGGIKAHLGVHDCRQVEAMIAEGNSHARLVYEAQAYQIAKGIGQLAPVLLGAVDAVILTGGIAYSEMLMSMIIDQVKYMGPVVVIPGENELESLALGALRIVRGEEDAHVYGEDMVIISPCVTNSRDTSLSHA